MNLRRFRADARGLTLIEIVLTLTILALAGALVSGAFTTGLRAWRSGLSRGHEELVARIVLERIATQLRAAIAAPARSGENDAVAFDADEDHLRFVTAAGPGTEPAHVFYGLENDAGGPHLVYREFPWPDKTFFVADTPRRQESIPEVIVFSIAVEKRDDTSEKSPEKNTSEKSLSAEWTPLDRELPASVTIGIDVKTQDQANSRHYGITVPIPTRRGPR